MKTYDVMIHFKGEGYATQRIRVEAPSPIQAETRAKKIYTLLYLIADPAVEANPNYKFKGWPWNKPVEE